MNWGWVSTLVRLNDANWASTSTHFEQIVRRSGRNGVEGSSWITTTDSTSVFQATVEAETALRKLIAEDVGARDAAWRFYDEMMVEFGRLKQRIAEAQRSTLGGMICTWLCGTFGEAKDAAKRWTNCRRTPMQRWATCCSLAFAPRSLPRFSVACGATKCVLEIHSKFTDVRLSEEIHRLLAFHLTFGGKNFVMCTFSHSQLPYYLRIVYLAKVRIFQVGVHLTTYFAGCVS